MHNLSAFEIERAGSDIVGCSISIWSICGSPLSLQLSRPFSISILPALLLQEGLLIVQIAELFQSNLDGLLAVGAYSEATSTLDASASAFEPNAFESKVCYSKVVDTVL